MCNRVEWFVRCRFRESYHEKSCWHDNYALVNDDDDDDDDDTDDNGHDANGGDVNASVMIQRRGQYVSGSDCF